MNRFQLLSSYCLNESESTGVKLRQHTKVYLINELYPQWCFKQVLYWQTEIAMHWTGDYWRYNSKDISCVRDVFLVQWKMTLLNAYSAEMLIELQLRKLNLCYIRKAYRMTSKHSMRVIDLVINLSCSACVCVRAHLHTHKCACFYVFKELLCAHMDKTPCV